MGSQKHTITLNGRLYDTTTGSILGSRSSKNNSTKVLDGFFSGAKSAQASHPGATARKTHAKAPNALAHKTEKAKTLIRSAVRKPLPTKSISKAPTNLDNSLSRDRKLRAHSIPKNGLISRFGSFASPSPIVKKTAKLPVKQHPVRSISQHQSQALAPTTAPAAKISEAEDIFNVALGHAESHKQASPKRLSRRHRLVRKMRLNSKIISVSSILLAALLLIGFFTYQNMASINVKIASTSANVPVTIPNYKPTGFSLSKNVQHNPGQIVLNFTSNSDERNYQITQQTSNWNSDTLLSTYVSAGRRQSQTIEDSGKTIFIYDDNNATWVDGGVWYRVEGKDALSGQQLLKIVNSL